MENYIVRVLRRDPAAVGRDAHLDGVVEVVESGLRRAFHNAEELWAILGEEIENTDGQVASLEEIGEEAGFQPGAGRTDES